MSGLRHVCWAVAGALLRAGAAGACPIPVYQYALEHWASDPYVMIVHPRGELGEEEREALDLLRRAERGEGVVANLKVRVEEDSGETGGEGGARLEVRYPPAARIRWPLWTGELTPENARAWISSPARDRLGELLARRTSAVWVLLESGNAAADREAETTLRRELPRIRESVFVPESAEWGGETVEIDHQVNFEVLKVRRDDPAERMLVRMLLRSEPDLERDFEGQPMVFPVFGRSLVLYALVGRGINPMTLQRAAEFLTGPCSCQVKAANPGTDLLMDQDWDARVRILTPATVGEAVGTGSFLRGLEEAERDPEGE